MRFFLQSRINNDDHRNGVGVRDVRRNDGHDEIHGHRDDVLYDVQLPKILQSFLSPIDDDDDVHGGEDDCNEDIHS